MPIKFKAQYISFLAEKKLELENNHSFTERIDRSAEIKKFKKPDLNNTIPRYLKYLK